MIGLPGGNFGKLVEISDDCRERTLLRAMVQPQTGAMAAAKGSCCQLNTRGKRVGKVIFAALCTPSKVSAITKNAPRK
jgi:hypothetical protein